MVCSEQANPTLVPSSRRPNVLIWREQRSQALPERNQSNLDPLARFGSRIQPMISQELLDILVCPACKRPVAPKPDGKGLKCPECRRVYPIQDDIPIMLVDEAVIDPS
jgi:uncharacterized protein YbaR (Trm112 family)